MAKFHVVYFGSNDVPVDLIKPILKEIDADMTIRRPTTDAEVVEMAHDADGIIWPKTLAPFDVIVTVTNTKDERLRETAEKLYKDLQRAGLETLLDDRDERAGVKFKDADLIGIPYRITLGKKVADGIVELFERQTKSSEDVKLVDIVSRVQRLALAGL